ncbi:MAG TPA: Rpn family recombination-promoting nuclease/putative transposase [Bacillus bacterium]|nr:Rpn family recombination-promoting nuclease/putative transposase [Bacillus sp. (in: firmicutes)]
MKNEKPLRPLKWLLPKNDFVFKLLVGSDDKHSKELLIHFLNDLFQVPEGQSISNVYHQNTHLNKQHLTNKASILDIRSQIPGIGIVNIEMQLENQYNMDKRSLFYCAKIITEQLDEGDNYNKLRKTTAITLLDFNYFNHNNYHSIYHLTEKKTGSPYPDILQLHFIEMKKIKMLHREGKIDENDQLAKWIEFFSNEDDSQWKVMASKHPIIKKAVERLEIISQNPENRWNYEIRQKTLKDITSMKEGAKDEGKIEGKIEVATKMLRKGIGIDTISEFTGFTKEELLELQKNIEKDH